MIHPLIVLAEAMAEFEGWAPGTRSWRNNNPLNIVHSSMERNSDQSGFTICLTPEEGFFQGVHDLIHKCLGFNAHGIAQDSTIATLICTWACTSPPQQQVNYITYVCKRLTEACGFLWTPTTPLRLLFTVVWFSLPGPESAIQNKTV